MISSQSTENTDHEEDRSQRQRPSGQAEVNGNGQADRLESAEMAEQGDYVNGRTGRLESTEMAEQTS